MSKLSLIPKGIVTAMQIALVSLILLAVVPIALGGLDVDMEGPEIRYENHSVIVSLDGSANSDLYFDINGFRYDISITSGGERMHVHGSDGMTIPRNGSTSIGIDVDIPLTSVIMMLLLCVNDENGMIMTIDAGASTLGGMLSVSASVDRVIAGDVVGIIEADGTDIGSFDELRAHFSVPSSELSDILFGPGTPVSMIAIGDMVIHITDLTTGAGVYDITLIITASAGGSITDDLTDAMDAGGRVHATYDGSSPVELTKEQTDLIVNSLNILYQRWSV